MRDNRIVDFIYSFVKAAENCRNNHLIVPALVLIYTSIDIFGSLVENEAKKDFELRKAENKIKNTFGSWYSFRYWVDLYINPEKNINAACGSAELYVARCGLLHELRLDSKKNIVFGTKIITYAWGAANTESLEDAVISTNNDYIAVHVDKLIEAWKSGIVRFLEDDKMQKSANEKSKKFVANLSIEMMDEFLNNDDEN